MWTLTWLHSSEKNQVNSDSASVHVYHLLHFLMSSTQVTTFTAHLPKVEGKSQHTDTDREYATGSQRNEKVRKGPLALQTAKHEVSARIPWQWYPASSPEVSFEITALKVLSSCEMSELQVGFPLKFMSLHLGQMGDRTSVTVSPLHMYLQVAYFQRWEHISACLITKVSSLVWHTFSCACILYKLLFFCVLYCTEYSSTVSLEIEMNPARNQNPSHQCQAWMKSQLALCLLLLMILQLHHLPPPLLPPVSNSSHLSTLCQPLYASSCTVYIIYVKSIINLWQYSTI